MTLQEAINTEKPFRIKTWNKGIWIQRNEIMKNYFIRFYTNHKGNIETNNHEWLACDILSNDWEVTNDR